VSVITDAYGHRFGRAKKTMTQEDCLNFLRETVATGEHWYVALLKTMARWTVAEEVIGERRYRYLIGGEAFDWLLLAERLIDEMDIPVSKEEREALLFNGHPPLEIDDDEFQTLIGTPKYQAYLNFLYGVVVEEALMFAVEDEMAKEQRAQVWAAGAFDGEGAYGRIYGRPLEDLRVEFQREQGMEVSDRIDYADLKEFTYWLFKYRVRNGEGARVASDTRKGLAALSRLEVTFRRRAETDAQAQEVTTVNAEISDREQRARRRKAFASGGFD
jgi:hypothetical protein